MQKYVVNDLRSGYTQIVEAENENDILLWMMNNDSWSIDIDDLKSYFEIDITPLDSVEITNIYE